MVDGVLRLPPPSDIRVQNISEIKHVVRLFEALIEKVCKAEVNGLEEVIEDRESLLTCLNYILKSESKKVQENAVRLFETVLFHPFFRCAHAKLSLLINAVDYLRNHYSEDKTEAERHRWKDEYNVENEAKEFEKMMKTAINENLILKHVYELAVISMFAKVCHQ
uniref:uncharacterized protein LOC101307041 n=1 Tax=Fragaria vesca subsp. vesca TaxID=101020 RepID=UPI0005CA96E9|nr:PREDICTED: uncharacterized protein LOC101307041 [Fragaria vesca subsp. vesca]